MQLSFSLTNFGHFFPSGVNMLFCVKKSSLWLNNRRSPRRH